MEDTVEDLPSPRFGVEHGHGDPNHLFRLPLELRQMIYRHVLMRFVKKNHVTPLKTPRRFIRRYEAEPTTPNDCISLLLTNKWVYEEASTILYEEQFFLFAVTWRTVVMCGQMVQGWKHQYPLPICLPKIRNLDIGIDVTPFCRGAHDWAITLGKNLRDLCFELNNRHLKIKNISLAIQCMYNGVYPESAGDLHRVRIAADELDLLLRPLTLLRASHSVEFKPSACRRLAHTGPVFDRVTAIMRSTAPVEALPWNYSEDELLLDGHHKLSRSH
ncbi:MAG: hypothetical protein Q9222_002253 [Ikaeria aurantiellina]